MLMQYASVLIFLAFGLSFTVGTLVTAYLVRRYRPSLLKYTTYECGEVPVGQSWVQFNLRFYVYALLFLVFDVEVAFIIPWAVVFKELGLFAFVEMMIFIWILILGLAYAWRKGALEWT